jgi:ubiquinone/menaquinone biosynthesis C-methylase UbiE
MSGRPGSLFDARDNASAYKKGRELPREATEVWGNALTELVPMDRARSIVDLGCGTGRFTSMLVDRSSARVIGIDPALAMLAECDAARDPRVRVLAAAAETLPLRSGSVDVVFLSMVYHHLASVPQAIDELRRVLGSDGHVAVRNTTRETLEDFSFMPFFPEVKSIDLARMPARHEVVDAFVGRGFRACAQRTVWYTIAASHEEYLKKIAARGFSSMWLIADDVFERRLAAFEAHVRATPCEGPVLEPVDLFVFQVGR